jgi:hypothetical protein
VRDVKNEEKGEGNVRNRGSMKDQGRSSFQPEFIFSNMTQRLPSL